MLTNSTKVVHNLDEMLYHVFYGNIPRFFKIIIRRNNVKNKQKVIGFGDSYRNPIVILSLSMFFFAIPHTLEDFALGEPAKNGVPAPVLAFVVASLLALQGLALLWVGQEDRRGYFIHAGLGVFWPLAAGIAQMPVILASSNYRSGFISVAYVAGMIVIGILLFLASLKALKTPASQS